jgi:plasminogen activator
VNLNKTGSPLIGLMFGYQQSSFSWTAKSRSYNDNHGTDPGMLKSGSPGPENEQEIGFPYVGLTGLYRYNKWEVNWAFKLNSWGKASNNDEQYSK